MYHDGGGGGGGAQMCNKINAIVCVCGEYGAVHMVNGDAKV